jgi:CRISPR system Cascade subunit CasE
MPEPLFLTSLKLKFPGLVALGHRQNLAMRHIDEAYLVHVWLCAAFGEDAMFKPWVVESHSGSELHIMGYSVLDAKALRAVAETNTTSEVFDVTDWSSCQSRAIPHELSPGTRVRIRARVCPTKRTTNGEKDAFLLAIEGKPRDHYVDREVIYADWMQDAVTRFCGGHLSDVRMTSFRLATLFRRVQGAVRKSTMPRLPEATMEATLTVGEKGIGELFSRGLGRHRSFGLGMVRVIPLREMRA